MEVANVLVQDAAPCADRQDDDHAPNAFEAFFNRHAGDGSLEVVMWQITFIDSLTQEPQPGLWYQGASDHPRAGPGFLRSLWRRLGRSG